MKINFSDPLQRSIRANLIAAAILFVITVPVIGWPVSKFLWIELFTFPLATLLSYERLLRRGTNSKN